MLVSDYSTDYIYRNSTDYTAENINFTRTCKMIAVIVWCLLIITGLTGF